MRGRFKTLENSFKYSNKINKQLQKPFKIFFARLECMNFYMYVNQCRSNETYILDDLVSAKWVEHSSRVQEIGVQSQVESYQRIKKWYLMRPCLTLSIIRYGLRVKWNDPVKGGAPFRSPRWSSYWKGSFWVTLVCDR